MSLFGENAGVMELADVTDSKSVGLITRVGSSPTAGTEKEPLLRGSQTIDKVPPVWRDFVIKKRKTQKEKRG